MSLLPPDDKLRKGLPLLKQIGYFPKALREITKVSVVNNVRYNPDRAPADINWNRGKSTDQLGSLFRHLYESAFGGKVFEDVPTEIAEKTGITRIYVLAELAWRANAALELAIEAQEKLEAAAPKPDELQYPENPRAFGVSTPAEGGPCVYRGNVATRPTYRYHVRTEACAGICAQCGEPLPPLK